MIIIAGAGIAGLSLGLTCHQLGLPFKIFEKALRVKPLGVGINIQPTATRELVALNLLEGLESIGVKTRELSFFTKTGLEIWSEPRGLDAGYFYPQFSVHRGYLQLLLYNTLIERCGEEVVQLGSSVTHCLTVNRKVQVSLVDTSGKRKTIEGSICIGADGINSSLRKQLYPLEGPPSWKGITLWRGTSITKPFRSGATMAMIGHASQRIVAYPISSPDHCGNVVMNWICERKLESSQTPSKTDWSKSVDYTKFLPFFKSWSYDWFNFPEMVQNSKEVLEYPMVDRDPVDNWQDERMLLIADAAHPAYPTGSNGATQAILDARELGKALIKFGQNPTALTKFQQKTMESSNQIILANRKSGPDAILQIVEDRCEGIFENLHDVISHEELSNHSTKFKSLIGLSIDKFNEQTSILGEYL